MKLLRSLDRLLCKAEFGLLVVSLSTMVLLAFAQVVMRNVFGQGFVWADTIIRHLVLWSGFVGAALATTDEKHISIDAITKFLAPRTVRIAHTFTSLFAAVVCYFLAQAAWTFLLEEMQHGDELILGIKTWQAVIIIPLGYGLIGFHFLIKLTENVAHAFGKSSDATAKLEGAR